MNDVRHLLHRRHSSARSSHAVGFTALTSLILLLIIVGFLSSERLTRPAYAAPPAQEPVAPPSVSGGRALWAENCLPCHGPIGKGDGPSAEAIPNPLPDFSDPDAARQRVPVEKFNTIKNGRIENLMPPWGNQLDDAQIWDLVAQVWSLSTTPEDLAAGETLYLEECAACHGEEGTGNGPEAPSEMIDLTDLQVMVQRSQADLQAGYLASDQHGQIDELSEDELRQTLDYVRTFTFIVPKRNGVLRGQAVNVTTNEPQGDLEVTLHVFVGDTEVETWTTQADGNGNFAFENLLTDHANIYVLESNYEGIVYLSDESGIFVPDSSETNLDLAVYDTTTSDAAISITQLHYLLSFSPGAVNVVQIFVVGNDDNRTYIGQNGQTFAFSLPAEAQQVTFQDDSTGTRFMQTGSGYVDTVPIQPGPDGLSIVSSYLIPYNDDSMTIEVPLPAEVASLNVLVSQQGVELSSEQVQYVETRDFQGGSFSIFAGANLDQTEPVKLELTHLDDLEFDNPPNAPNATVTSGPIDQAHLRWIVIGLGGLAIVGVGLAYPLMRPKLTHQVNIHDESASVRRQKLLLMLVRLDEIFEAGELDEEIYRRARAKYKTELVEQMRG
jgi:mono/diheme cytochrome c family protein